MICYDKELDTKLEEIAKQYDLNIIKSITPTKISLEFPESNLPFIEIFYVDFLQKPIAYFRMCTLMVLQRVNWSDQTEYIGIDPTVEIDPKYYYTQMDPDSTEFKYIDFEKTKLTKEEFYKIFDEIPEAISRLKSGPKLLQIKLEKEMIYKEFNE